MLKIYSKIVSKVKGLLLDRVCYFDKNFYSLNEKGLNRSERQKKVIIVSRHGYSEYSNWLPVTRRSEALKLVKFEQAARGPEYFYILGQPINGKTPVTWYVFRPEVLLLNALVLIPETVLWGNNSDEGNIIVYQTLDRSIDVYVTCLHNRVLSAIKGGIFQSEAQFMLAQGAAFNNVTFLDSIEYQKKLVRAISTSYKISFRGLINRAVLHRRNRVHSWSKYFLPIAGAFTIYLLSINYWAQFHLQSSQLTLRSINQKTEKLLTEREKIDQMLSRYVHLEQSLPESGDSLVLWHVLAPLYLQGVIINNIQYREQQVHLLLEAPSATEALQLLMLQPEVMQARVVGTVRRQGSKELATVSFTLPSEVL